jgi:putative phosphoribosyl transferase
VRYLAFRRADLIVIVFFADLPHMSQFGFTRSLDLTINPTFMITTTSMILQNREEGAHLLADRLMEYRNGNTMVVGVGLGGASIGFSLAKELNLPFELVLCRKIEDPGDPNRTIGSVSDCEVLIHNESHDMPQDFLAHQVSKLQYEIKSDLKFLLGDRAKPSFQNVTVIMVCDLLDNSDKLVAALRSIKAQKPLQIILAAPFVTSQAVTSISDFIDDLVFLRMEPSHLEGEACYENFPNVNLSEAKRLLKESIKRVN